MSTNPQWKAFRMRLSLMWRRRIALIIGAILIVVIYATGQTVGYTLISSIIATIILALLTYVRPTRDEARREEFDIPDSRDIHYHRSMDKLQESREEAQRLKKERNKKNKE